MSPPMPAAERTPTPLQVRDRERYDVVAEHGRGGLGRVSRARDKELGRDVAIKELIKRGDAREVRFVREALITARLEHPGIVPVHEAGCWDDGTPFYAMKLVSGRPLKELIRERSADERLELLPHVIAIADAIAYAHGRRIIHRDLKPSNVIVGEFGETIVVDWGLAKDLSERDAPALDHAPDRSLASNDLTATGSVLGTPAYMAPEQARGEPVDERVDVFAIGAMLWELCTRARIPADTEQRRRVLRREGVDRDLVTIVTKALAPHPRDRYPGAAALATDLKAFQAGARIASRNYSLLAMLAHWARRQRRLAISIAVATLVALVSVIWFVRNIAAERDRADASATEARVQQRRAEQITDELTLRHAELQLRSDPTAAMAALSGYRGSDRSQLRRLRAEALGRGVAAATVRPHSDLINVLTSDASGAILSISRDRTLRLTRGGSSTTLATDLAIPVAAAYARDANLFAYAVAHSGIALLDLSTRTTTRVEAEAPYSIDLLPGGSQMAVVSTDGTVTVWRLGAAPAVVLREVVPGARDLRFAGPAGVIVQTGNALRRIALDAQHRSSTIALAAWSFDASAQHVVTGDGSGAITVLSPELTVLSRASPCRKAVASVRFVPHGDTIAFACEDGTAGVARHDGGATLVVVDTFTVPERPRLALPDATGTRIVVSVDSSAVYVYDLPTRLVTRYDGQPTYVMSIAAPTATMDQILVGDSTGHIRVWDPPRRDARILLQGPSAVFSVEFSPDGKSLVAATSNGLIREVGIADGAITEVRGHGDSVLRARYSADGRSIVSWSGDRTVRVWRADGGAPLRVFTEHGAVSEAAAFVESDRRIVSIGDDGRLLAWSPEGSELSVIYARPLALTALEVLSGSSHMIVKDGSSAVWDVAPDGSAQQVRASDGAAVTVLRASPDGRLLAIGTDRGAVTVHSTSDWAVLHTVSVGGPVRQIKIDPHNRDLMIASTDGHVHALALGGSRALPWSDIPISVRNLDYAPDGETVAFVGNNGGTWFYELGTDTWAFTMDHASEILMGAFSPDGALFASGDRRGTVTLRDVAATFAAVRDDSIGASPPEGDRSSHG